MQIIVGNFLFLEFCRYNFNASLVELNGG